MKSSEERRNQYNRKFIVKGKVSHQKQQKKANEKISENKTNKESKK